MHPSQFSRFFVLLTLVFGSCSERASAQAPSQIENPRRANRSWVADSAGVLSLDEERNISAVCAALKAQNGAEMAVVIVRNVAGRSIKDYSIDLARAWQIGKNGNDNGVLLLATVDDRQIRIETGYGVEGELPDGKTGEIRRTQISPALADKRYGAGLYAGAVAIAQAIEPNIVLPAGAASTLPSSSQPSIERPISPSIREFPAPVRPSAGGGLIIALMGLLVFLFPLFIIGGVVWYFTAAMKRPLRCSKCRAAVQQLSDVAELPSLSAVQQFEQQIGARDYRVWRCEKCHNQDITAHDLPYSQFEQCPTCRHQTASSLIEAVREPTPWQGGLERVILSCQWPQCKHANFYNRATPPARRGGYGYGGGYNRGYGSTGSDLLTGIVLGSILNGSNHSGGWGSGGDSGGGWSGGDSGGSSGGFDSGPSDFGGGDFGGGGSDGGY